MVGGRAADEVGEVGELQVGCCGRGCGRGLFGDLGLGLASELDQEGSGLLGWKDGMCVVGVCKELDERF